MEFCILLPQRDQVLPVVWVLPHALHSDVAHVQPQMQETRNQETQVKQEQR